MKVRPYVYRCEHKETGRFYIGYRSANKVPADQDLGFYYFTSCKEVRNNFSEYSYEILSEYDNIEMAYEVEQVLLYNLRHDPLLINGDNFRKKNHITLDPKPAQMRESTGNLYKDRRKAFKGLPRADVATQRNKSRNIKPPGKTELNNSGFQQYISIYKKLKSNKIDSKVKKFFKKNKLNLEIYIKNPKLLEYR